MWWEREGFAPDFLTMSGENPQSQRTPESYGGSWTRGGGVPCGGGSAMVPCRAGPPGTGRGTRQWVGGGIGVRGAALPQRPAPIHEYSSSAFFFSLEIPLHRFSSLFPHFSSPPPPGSRTSPAPRCLLSSVSPHEHACPRPAAGHTRHIPLPRPTAARGGPPAPAPLSLPGACAGRGRGARPVGDRARDGTKPPPTAPRPPSRDLEGLPPRLLAALRPRTGQWRDGGASPRPPARSPPAVRISRGTARYFQKPLLSLLDPAK